MPKPVQQSCCQFAAAVFFRFMGAGSGYFQSPVARHISSMLAYLRCMALLTAGSVFAGPSSLSSKLVQVAKMDGTTNEHTDLQIQGFPHLVLFPAGPDAQPVPYDGDRSLKVQGLPPRAVRLRPLGMTH